MKLFNDLRLKFEKPDWASNPEFGLIDTILEAHPFLYGILKEDICCGTKESIFGRKDTPSVEQIVRAALYKELKNLNTGNWNTHKKIRGYARHSLNWTNANHSVFKCFNNTYPKFQRNH